MRPMLVTIMACLALTSAAAAQDLSVLSFMSGSWYQKSGNETIYESWMRPQGSVVLGMALTSEDGKAANYEYLRIEATPDGIDYVAQPSGQPETRFRATSISKYEVVFENPAHDFPKKIAYTKCGQDLCARIEGNAAGGFKSLSFRMKRQREPGRSGVFMAPSGIQL